MITFWQLEATKLGTHMIGDKNFFSGRQNQISFWEFNFSSEKFCLHLHLCLIMPSGNKRLLTTDVGLFQQVWSFVPPSQKGLRELNICQKWLRNKGLWTGSQKIKKLWKDCEWAHFCCTCLFIYGLCFTLA